jgi:hypothetical protein
LLVLGCSRTDLSTARLEPLPSVIDVGFAECGGSAPQTSIALKNDGDDALSLRLSADAPFTISDDEATTGPDGALSVMIGPRSSSTLTILGPAATPADRPGHVINGVLHVVMPDFGETLDRALSSTTRGGSLLIAPANADLGDIPVATHSPPQTVTVTNVGNEPVGVHLVPPPIAELTVSFADVTLAAGASAQGTLSFYGFGPGALETAIPFTIEGVACGPVAGLTVSANAVDGSFGVTPGSLDFGSVPCGGSAQPQTLQLLNGGDAPYEFQASSVGGSFTVTPSSGVVTSSTVLTIQPAPVPNVVANLGLDDTLTIVTSIHNDFPHSIPVKERAYGAILSFASPTLSFGRSDVGTKKYGGEVLNSGNAPVVVYGTAGSFEFPSVTVSPGQGSGSVQYSPDPAKLGLVDSSTLTLGVIGPMCSPPPSIQLDGTSHDLVTELVALDDATCAGALHGNVYCWGSNAKGQFATQSPSSATTPFLVPVLQNHEQVGGGGAFVTFGEVAWGTVNGQTMAPFSMNPVSSFFGGSDAVVCIPGTACMGKGGYLGNGTTTDSAAFLFVAGLSVSDGMDTGFDGHTCAPSGNGLACWGPDDWGQLGDGNWGSSELVTSPITTSALADISLVAAGDGFTCGLRFAANDVVCWGRNTSGECGASPSATPVLTPNVVAIPGATYPIDAGRDFTCVAGSNASIWCWGSSSVGQLGDGGSESYSATPVKAIATGGSFRAGGRHACARTNQGGLECWGQNTSGELGNGTTTSSSTPVVVTGFE